MPTRGGYVKAYRSMLDWQWHDHPATFSLFMHLIMIANQEDKKWHGIEVPRGSVITSQRNLHSLTGIPQTSIIRALERLVECESITTKTVTAERNCTLITICKYDLYQGCLNIGGAQTERERSTGGAQMERERSTDGARTELTKENKNKRKEEYSNKNKNKKEDSETFSIQELTEYVNANKVPITEKGIERFHKFNEKLPTPYNGGDLETAFEIFLEKPFNRKFKKVIPRPPAIYGQHGNQPPPPPISIQEIARKSAANKVSEDKWAKVLDKMAESIGISKTRTYFANKATTATIEADNTKITLSTTKFLMEYIEAHYLDALQKSFKEILGCVPKLEYKISN